MSDLVVAKILTEDDSRGAQRVMNYLGLLGTAALVSFDGKILLSSDRSDLPSLGAIAKHLADCAHANEMRGGERIAHLDSAGACTYFARVGSSEAVFIVVDNSILPAAVVERLSLALAVFDRVMGTPPNGSGGTPDGALGFAAVSSPRRA